VQSRISLANGTTSVESTFVTDLLVGGLFGTDLYKLTSVIVQEALADVGDSAWH